MYVKVSTLQVFTREQLQSEFMDPYVGFPPEGEVTNAVLALFGFALLEFDTYPAVMGIETIIAGPLRNDDGRVFQSWTVEVPTVEAITAQFVHAASNLLDTTAQAHGYDNINTVVSYAEEPAVVKFQQDGIAFRKWRSEVWDYAYTQMSLVKTGVRAQPTVSEFLVELPQLVNPT